MVPVGHAGDGGGSIRIPASECGLVGLKPSRGRVSLGPDVAESWGGLVARLAVTRSVRDTALVLDALHGLMPGDPYDAPAPTRPYAQEVGADPGRLRIGVRTTSPVSGVAVDPECVAATENAARLLESLGHDVTPAVVDGLDDEGLIAAFFPCFASWVAADLVELEALCGDPVGPDDVETATWELAQLGRSITALDFLAGMEGLNTYRRRVAEWWVAGNDLLLTPTIPMPPPLLGKYRENPDDPEAGGLMAAATIPFTVPFNATGQPAISLPLHYTASGLPVGVQLVAAYGREDVLIRVAAQLEQAAPWADRRPGIAAT
jgi:amidase